MKRRFKIIAFCLLLSECVYSQNVLVDNNGDTLVAITIQQMDDIYVELIQKDSLMAQSEISRFKTLKYVQLLDSADKDISTLRIQLNIVSSDYSSLLYVSEQNKKKIKRNRKIALYGWASAILSGFLLWATN
tara:strand:+ start:4119 stop:4514 length:396 start_codon:yes stop_codon:yes gene_type:complete